MEFVEVNNLKADGESEVKEFIREGLDGYRLGPRGHLHTIVFTVFDTPINNNIRDSTGTLHYWRYQNHEGPDIYTKHIDVDATLCTLEDRVWGYRYHGSIFFELRENKPPSHQVHGLLSRPLAMSELGFFRGGLGITLPEVNEAIIYQLVHHLNNFDPDRIRNIPNSSWPTPIIKVYSISVVTSTPDALLSENLVWKWWRPAIDIPGTNGQWTETFDETIESAMEKCLGSKFVLLCAGVSKEQKESMFRDGKKPWALSHT